MKKKAVLYFDSFLTSLSVYLNISYKELAEFLEIQEASFSKVRHGYLRHIPQKLSPQNASQKLIDGICSKFERNEASLRIFSSYAKELSSSFFLSPSAYRYAQYIVQFFSLEGNHKQMMDSVFTEKIPSFLSDCYCFAYSNGFTPRPELQHISPEVSSFSISHQLEQAAWDGILDRSSLLRVLNTVRDVLNGCTSHKTFLSQKMEHYLSPVQTSSYYEFSKHRESIFIRKNVLYRELCGNFLFFPGETEVTEFQIPTGLPESFSTSSRWQLVVNSVTIDGIPLEEYNSKHFPNMIYSHCEDSLVQKTESSQTDGQKSLRFHLWPKRDASPFKIHYEMCLSIAADAVSCFFFEYRLDYPCAALEHEIHLDPVSCSRWNLSTVPFFPYPTEVTGQENSDDSQMNPTNTHIFISQWTLPGNGYTCFVSRF